MEISKAMNPTIDQPGKSIQPSSPAPPPLQGRIRPKATIPAPAPPPGKPRERPERVAEPRRLRAGRKTRKIGGVFIADSGWGCPFRPREVEGRWFAAWVGAEMDLEDLRPPDWRDVSCESRLEAAQIALCAFEDWLLSPAMAHVLRHAKRTLRGLNLKCLCPEGWPCHGDVLIRLLNDKKEEG
jgi:hypothetical protein